jgi:putative hydrolase of the HAD superfamily
MPVIEFAEESLFSWLDQNYPRITRRYNRDDMVTRRKQFMQDKPEYAINLTLMRHEFLRLLARESDYDGDIVADRGFEVFFHARQQVTFYDDVIPCLQRLKQSYRLGSISNGNASVEHVGLGDIFEHSVSAADINVAKPDRRIFDRLADRFAAPPEKILYVGDHPEYDVVAPEQAGMQAAWINRENIDWPAELPEPKFQVNNLQELEVLLSNYR